MELLTFISENWHTPAYFSLAALIVWLLYEGRFIRYIPNNRVGVIEKLFSLGGSVDHGIIALDGQAGFEPEVLRGGWHVMKPFIYRIHKLPLVTVPQGTLGYIFARDGESLLPQQTLASNERAHNFEDAREFLTSGGQKGPQRKILREGTYAINLAQFIVITQEGVFAHNLDDQDGKIFREMASEIRERDGFTPIIIKGHDDALGVVTIHDGPSLAEGEIIAPIVGAEDGDSFHNNFQDPEAFLRGGGRRGRQYQVLVEGTYYINRLFGTVEILPKTTVDVGSVGVVVSYTGALGLDVSGASYKHGELVHRGERGVWEVPLLPGKYAFNPYAGQIIMVPTTNFILKWKKSESGAHKFDENLAEVSLITKDAFEPSLPLSVVVHIDYKKAPLVIQRFGDIKRLVEQTLDPMVSAYFKNVGQTRTLIELLQDRSAIQQIASEEMKTKFEHYNLELEEVLIGTPTSSADSQIDQILTQLRSRQVAVEQIETYSRQQAAAGKERELREAATRASEQDRLTASEIAITVQANQGKADYQRALQQASQIRALAEAEAEKAARIGIAQAMATEEQVRAYGGARYQVLQHVAERIAQAIEKSGVDIVPKVVIGESASKSSVLDSLLSLMLSEKMGVDLTEFSPNAQADAIKQQIRSTITKAA